MRGADLSGGCSGLDRFVSAQDDAGTYERAFAELRRGAKVSHWMWFVFPQLAGLGSSPMSVRFAIRSLDEARSYLEHPLLGRRIRECAQALLELEGRSAVEVFGPVDAMKLRSSMTLFHLAAPQERLFSRVLGQYYEGDLDETTTALLGAPEGAVEGEGTG